VISFDLHRDAEGELYAAAAFNWMTGSSFSRSHT